MQSTPPPKRLAAHYVDPAKLTPREAEIYALYRDGLGPKGIAEKLGISTQTVASILSSDLSGSGVNNNGWYAGNAGLCLTSVNNHTRWNTVRAGVNYHFNWGASAPVISNY